MLESFKKFILWNYSRGTWQYDIFCLLIIAFIFLTPKAWFEKREKLTTQTTRLIVKAEDFSKETGELSERARKMNGNADAEILEWREKKDEKGETFYEIEIRR